MKTSVVISTYNGKKYIEEQLDSIRLQTRPVDQVLIFDDGSNDGTPRLISDYLEKHQLENWQIKVNQVNKGWRRNFMEGMWAAEGEIVFPCDQDDIWDPQKVEKMANLLEQNDDISVLVSTYEEFFPDGKKRLGPWADRKEVFPVQLGKDYMVVPLPGCAFAIRRSELNISQKYWQEGFAHDDLLWRLGLFDQSLYVLPEPLINWRKHYDSAFAKEARGLKSINAKIEWLKSTKMFNDALSQYLQQDIKNDIANRLDVINKNNQWLNLRLRFYESKDILAGLKLIRYWSYYPRKRQLLGDWYLVTFNKQ